MDATKPWYASRTVWAGLVAVAVPAIGALGYTVGTEDQEAIVTALMGIGSAVAGLLAIYGRVKATKPIKGTKE